MRRIATIVEGQGEVLAVPSLLARIVAMVLPETAIEIAPPIRVKRQQIVKPEMMERALNLAARRAGPGGGILILLDANGDCPGEFGPELLRHARQARGDRAIRVVLAKTRYEAWFLAAGRSIAGECGFDPGIEPPTRPEEIRDAKGWLSARMSEGQSYRPTIHQKPLTGKFNLHAARAASASFDKMCRDVESLAKDPE